MMVAKCAWAVFHTSSTVHGRVTSSTVAPAARSDAATRMVLASTAGSSGQLPRRRHTATRMPATEPLLPDTVGGSGSEAGSIQC